MGLSLVTMYMRNRSLATEILFIAELWYPHDVRALSGGDLNLAMYLGIFNQRNLPLRRVTNSFQNVLCFTK